MQWLRNKTIFRSLNVLLKGNASNRFAIGAKVLIKQKDRIQFGYVNTTKGFESSSLQYVHFGMKQKDAVGMLQVLWPDGKSQSLFNVKTDQRISISYQPDTNFQYTLLPSADNANKMFKDITGAVDLPYQHHENDFNDFNIQPLIPHKVQLKDQKWV